MMTVAEIIEQVKALPLSDAEKVCEAVNQVLRQPQKPLKEREFGSMKNLVIYLAEDFDAPLEDFKDYM